MQTIETRKIYNSAGKYVVHIPYISLLAEEKSFFSTSPIMALNQG